jgi:hypothetical protein
MLIVLTYIVVYYMKEGKMDGTCSTYEAYEKSTWNIEWEISIKYATKETGKDWKTLLKYILNKWDVNVGVDQNSIRLCTGEVFCEDCN